MTTTIDMQNILKAKIEELLTKADAQSEIAIKALKDNNQGLYGQAKFMMYLYESLIDGYNESLEIFKE